MASMVVNELGPMLTASEVADMLHLHVNTVKRLGDRGELPFYRVCKRGDRRFRLEDVMRFLSQNRRATADSIRPTGDRCGRFIQAVRSASPKSSSASLTSPGLASSGGIQRTT
jgi:excisionase family DNA binding protein